MSTALLDRPTNILETLESYSHHITLRSYKISLEDKLASPTSLTEEVLEKDTIVLAASGGTAPYPNKMGVKGQENDVFIQSLRMTSVNGLNGGGQGRVSPVVQLEMSIVETGGAEFLTSLTAGTAILTQRETAQEVVLRQEAPFLVTISFNDQTASGKRVDLSGYTKHIKVRITKCQFTIKASGVYYELICTPYSHMALTDIGQSSAIGGAYSIEGSTIGEFINGPKGIKAALIAALKSNNPEIKGEEDLPYSYEFKFHNAIGEAFRDSALAAVSSGNEDTNIDQLPFNNPTDLAPQNEQQAANAGVAPGAPAAGSSDQTADTQKETRSASSSTATSAAAAGNIRKINITKETPIQNVIEKLVMNSAYIKEQATKDPKDFPPFIPFVKVIPIMETARQDPVKGQNKIKKKIIFNIIGIQIPFVRATNSKDPEKAKTAMDKIKAQTIRAYNYLFTGGNRSILNFDLRYDNLFVQAHTSWNRTFSNQNQQADRQRLDPEKKDTVPNAAQAPKDNPANVRKFNDQDTSDTPTETGPQLNTNESSGIPKDYDSAAQWFRTNLSEIFSDQVERSSYRILVDLVGDPDFISEYDMFPTQAALEAKIGSGSSSAATPASPGTAGSPGGAAVAAASFNPLEPQYLQFVIGNAKGKALSQAAFAGFYVPVKFMHTFEKGRFVTQVDAYRLQGVSLKTKIDVPDAGAQDVINQEIAQGSFESPPAGASAAQGVATASPPGSSGSPGNTPPAEYIVDAAKAAVPKLLPSTTAAPKSPEEAKQAVDKSLGGSIDASPDEDVSAAPSNASIVDAMKATNKLNADLQKLAATVPDAVGKMSGELNSMMDGLSSKASGLMSKAGGALSGGLSKLTGGLKSAAGSAAKEGLSKLKGLGSAVGGGATAMAGGPTVGTSNVVESATNALAKAAPELESAAAQLSAKIQSFQIPGMPKMAGPTVADISGKIKEAAAKLGPEAGGAIEKLKGEGTKLASDLADKVKDVAGPIGAIDPQKALAAVEAKVSGAGLSSAVGSLTKAAGSLSSTVTGALTSASGSLTKALGGATGAGLSKAATSVAQAGASALSGVVSAASKGLGGTSLSDAVKTAATQAAGPLSGLKNSVSTLSEKVGKFEFTKVEIEVPNLSGEIASVAAAAKGELAKLSLPTIGSTPGLSQLGEEAKTEIAKKLSIGSLAKSNAFANTIPGTVKAVGLNDVAPAMVMDPLTGQFEAAPSPADIAAMKENAANLNKTLTSAFQKNLAPSLQSASASVSAAANSAVSKLTGGG